MVPSKRRPRIPPITEADAIRLVTRIDERAAAFVGQIDALESAIGMQFLGRLFGWKVLALTHNKRTIRKYEGILGIDIRKEFPETGPLASKSVGLGAAERLGAFWKAVSGDLPVEGKREIQA
jgi:hypothetical protein